MQVTVAEQLADQAFAAAPALGELRDRKWPAIIVWIEGWRGHAVSP